MGEKSISRGRLLPAKIVKEQVRSQQSSTSKKNIIPTLESSPQYQKTSQRKIIDDLAGFLPIRSAGLCKLHLRLPLHDQKALH